MRKLISILLGFAALAFSACGPAVNPGGDNGNTGEPETPVPDYEQEFTLGFWFGVPNGVYKLTESGGYESDSNGIVYTREYTDEETSAFYAKIKDAGFNISFPECYNTSKSYNLKILKAAKTADIRQMIQDGNTTWYLMNSDAYAKVKAGTLSEADVVAKVSGYLADYKAYSSFYGLMLMDEPDESKLEQVGWAKKIIEQVIPDKLFYCNLLPVYGISNPADFDRYDDYIDGYLENTGDNGFLSYDFYPMLKGNLIAGNWLRNLYSIRTRLDAFDEKNDANTALWTFVQSVEHGNFRALTSKADATFQAYCNMAFGARGIFWFTFWQPNPSAEHGYKAGMLDMYGNETPTYGYVKEANAELAALSETICKYKWKGFVTGATADPSGNLYTVKDLVKNPSKALKEFRSTKDAICAIYENAQGESGYLAVNFSEPTGTGKNTVTFTLDGVSQVEIIVGGKKTIADVTDGKVSVELQAGQAAFVSPVKA